MTSEKGCRKEKNQNIQVFVRLRPLNQRERDIKSLGVIEVVNGREVVVRQSQQSMHTKRFTFDRAFPPHAKQVEVYQEVVSPLIEEVLAGYNCTVFAYGQTGTGKTHTMVGEAANDETTWQSDPLAGIIPRALSQLFDELRISNTEYTVRVSYLELYNEELFDLLSTSEDNSKLRIYEDVTRKGANIVNGLEEITVYNKNEVFKIMAQGQERKRVASTLMNAQSSRSHTVFTIVVHMKENSPEGEELVKIGKLNLVDLAGSENISKAGSDNPAKRERARECVNINQSLLTLGRVITALVERHPHIPYRESKLTRILQESLGGRTKTSIIATISPGHKDLEETMSTLEYANRAKNIQNKPEVNQKMTKKAILKDYAEEIDRLKRDLHAAREKNGVYLANETFTEMTLKQEEQRKEIQELLLKKRAMEEEKEKMETVFKELNCSLEKHKQKLDLTVNKLCDTENKLANTTNILNSTKLHYEEQKYLVSKQSETENKLSTQAKQLLEVADMASTDAAKLLDTVDRRKCVESTNLEITRTYREISSQHRNNLTGGTENFVGTLMQSLADIQTALDTYTQGSTDMQNQTKQKLDDLVQKAMDAMNKMKTLKNNIQSEITSTAQNHSSQFDQAIDVTSRNLQNILERLATCVLACLQKTGDFDISTSMTNFIKEWQAMTMSNLSSLHTTSGKIESSVSDTVNRLRLATKRQRDDRVATCERLSRDIQQRLTSIMDVKNQMEKYLAAQVTNIENEKAQYESRLLEWAEVEKKRIEEERKRIEEERKRKEEEERKRIEEERKRIEEERKRKEEEERKRIEEERKRIEEERKRIERHITSERKFLESRMKEKLKDIENQKAVFEQQIVDNVNQLNSMLVVNQELMEKIGEDLVKNEKELNVCVNDLKNFVQDYEKDHTDMTSRIDSFSDGALEVVKDVKKDLLENLQQTKAHVQHESRGIMEQNQQSLSKLSEESNKLVESITQTCQQTLDTFVGEVNQTTMSTMDELSSLSSITSTMASSSLSHRNGQTQALSTVQRDVEQFYGGVREEVARLEELERRCLNQEYAVYNPTGSTPVRADYRYPRALAATSPHDRILARFRAMRQDSNDDDCIVIENECEARSDSESSVSSDSAVVFVAPSPPDGGNQRQPPIVKCTSETDIYLRRRRQEQQGKENANLSISFKKPSKLRAPSSHKKPLFERNLDN